MKIELEVIVGKETKGKTQKVSAENITPINEQKNDDKFTMIAIQEETIRFLKNKESRDSEEAAGRVESVKSKKEVDIRVLRSPETKFQNTLLRIIHQRGIKTENVKHFIKETLRESKKENSLEMQQSVEAVLKGVKSCEEAARFLEKEMESEYKDENIWIATNDQVDAIYQIDLLAGAENENGFIKILKLVQVKSEVSDRKIENITETHQAYLDTLPQLIGILNKKEAAAIAEKEINSEVIDIEREEKNKEQLTFFGLALDEYISSIEDPKKANAVDFFQLLKKENIIFSPFSVMGILKNKKVMDEYRTKGYFDGNKEKEDCLAKTANDIPYTEAESIAFHRKNHLHTILNSAKIISVVMVGEKKVSEKELKHPYDKKLN